MIMGITSTYVENTKPFIDTSRNIIGSPPHTWRIPPGGFVDAGSERITSTYVENTAFLPLPVYMVQDHLHIRGEYRK